LGTVTIKTYRTANPNLWEATATWKEGNCLRMVNGEGRTEEEARANLAARLSQNDAGAEKRPPEFCENHRAGGSVSTSALIIAALLALASAACAQEPARPHPRLSADLNPVGSRVLFRAWDNAANNWSVTISDGIVEEYSPATISTSAGPRVPKLVKLSGAWQPNPKWEDTIPPPTIGLTLLYFAGETFLGQVDIDTQTHSAKLEVRKRIASGTLWSGENVTDAQAQSATLVVFQQWEYLTGERSGKWEIEKR
jgi:hypothetical protein